MSESSLISPDDRNEAQMVSLVGKPQLFTHTNSRAVGMKALDSIVERNQLIILNLKNIMDEVKVFVACRVRNQHSVGKFAS